MRSTGLAISLAAPRQTSDLTTPTARLTVPTAAAMAIVSDRYMKGFDRALRKLARLVKKATVRHTRPGPLSGYFSKES
jgi:hypothetical protein